VKSERKPNRVFFIVFHLSPLFIGDLIPWKFQKINLQQLDALWCCGQRQCAPYLMLRAFSHAALLPHLGLMPPVRLCLSCRCLFLIDLFGEFLCTKGRDWLQEKKKMSSAIAVRPSVQNFILE